MVKIKYISRFLKARRCIGMICTQSKTRLTMLLLSKQTSVTICKIVILALIVNVAQTKLSLYKI